MFKVWLTAAGSRASLWSRGAEAVLGRGCALPDGSPWCSVVLEDYGKQTNLCRTWRGKVVILLPTEITFCLFFVCLFYVSFLNIFPATIPFQDSAGAQTLREVNSVPPFHQWGN